MKILAHLSERLNKQLYRKPREMLFCLCVRLAVCDTIILNQKKNEQGFQNEDNNQKFTIRQYHPADKSDTYVVLNIGVNVKLSIIIYDIPVVPLSASERQNASTETL